MPDEAKLLAYLKRVTGELHEARSRSHAAVMAEPVAIVGMACRLPGGVRSPEDLWAMVTEGRDGIGPFPTDRGWDLDNLFHADPDHPGTTYATEAGFLHDAGLFDAGFFGISPREAASIDPQQRLLLEVTWETLERAGLNPRGLKGANVGVFTGVFGQGYGATDTDSGGTEGVLGTGVTTSVASGRISYTLGLEGPAVTIDTACSSSLVAMHLAAQSLRQGECSMALAGGVTVMPSPALFVGFSRQRALASDGRCKSFAASADGTGWSEGIGIVLMEKLSDARRNGHPVLAVLRGSALNQDGASNGLTAPNGPAQQRVIRKALTAAGLAPADVDAVEAHGTGTTLGDPIEAQALLATYGRDRGEPLWLGSLKSNIGHTLAAAGVAGVIKMVMALRHGVLPQSRYADEPTAQVDWGDGSVRLLAETRDWPRVDRPRRAAVSSFGISGTNAHLILEQAPETAPVEPAVVDGPVPVVVSGKGPQALAAQAQALHDWWQAAPDAGLGEVAWALAQGRAALSDRGVVVAASREEALSGLAALAAGEPAGDVATGVAGKPGRLVLVFPGQGTQWLGMGADLLDASPVFAEVVDHCDALLDWSLVDVLRGNAPLDAVDVVQPASFAVMIGLAAVWETLGVRPDAVVGHSQGEIAAAYVAGGLTLQDAMHIVVARSQLVAAELAGAGAMVSVALPADQITGVEIAAVNGPSSTVVAGPVDVIDAWVADREAEGVRVRRIAVDYASHTSQVEAIREQLLEALAGIRPVSGVRRFYSSARNAWMDTSELDAGYWFENLRQPVRFAEAVQELSKTHGVFVEASSHPVLVPVIEQGVAVGTLRRGEGGLQRLLLSAAELHTAGVGIDWPLTVGRHVELPTYAFQHEHYWLKARAPGDVAGAGQVSTGHPILSAAVPLPGSDGVVLTGRLSLRTHPWLADHQVSGRVLLPGAVLVEAAIRAGDEVAAGTLEELVLESPIVLPAKGGLRLQIVVAGPDAGGHRNTEVYTAPDDRTGATIWTRHATGVLSDRAAAAGTAGFDATVWPPAGADPVPVGDFYERLAGAGYAYGPAFHGVGAVWADGDTVYAEVALPEGQREQAAAFGIHPALLDAALQSGMTRTPAEADPGDLRMPFSWTGVTLHAAGATALRVKLAPQGPDGVTLSVTDNAGNPVLTVASLITRPVSADQLDASTALVRDALLRVEWTPRDAPELSGDPVDVTVFEPPTDADSVRAALTPTLGRLQEWLVDPAVGRHRLLVVTRDAIAGTGDPAAAAVWGLVRAAQAEHTGRIVLLDTDPGTALGDDLIQAALATGEPQLAYRDGRWSTPALVRVPAAPDDETTTPLFDPDGTVLITGGTGAFGANLARHLRNEHGVRKVVLAGRRGLAAPGAEDLRDELGVDILACDVADRAALASLLDTVRSTGRLTAVIHAAAAGHPGEITGLTGDQLDATLAAAVDGARHLHDLTLDDDLEAFVLCTSAAGTIAAPGQGATASAAAYLDALARQRHTQGRPAAALAWGSWAPDAPEVTRLFDAAVRTGLPALVVAGVDLRTMRGLVPATRRSAVTGGMAERTALAQRLAGLPTVQAEQAVLEVVRRTAAGVVGQPGPDRIDPDRAFSDSGFDSLTAVELRNRLLAATGVRLPVTVIFDHPTPRAVARFVLDELGVGERATAPVVRAPARADEPIAIVAMGCRLPGGVRSPEALWDLVRAGEHGMTAFPQDRGWDLDNLFHPDPDHPGTTYGTEAGFLDDATLFDPGFFGISPREALVMDPQQRLLLETSWEALERAGIDPVSLRGGSVGVFAGVAGQSYAAEDDLPEGMEGFMGTGSLASVVSGRVSYLFGFEGPALTVDTACSSSLVAMHLAGQALQRGECDLALAGGVTVLATPSVFRGFARQRGLAQDSRVKSFSSDADGTVLSEGVGVLLLERLSDARRNGHPVLAVMRGSAVNQDGASNGLTAPNGPSQQRVIRRALAVAGVAPADVDAVEAHGTGTKLGDPIEAQALLATYGAGERPEPLWVGSVKSNIGHPMAAAGAAGVIKMVMAMRHGILPRSLHVGEPSDQVDWTAGDVQVLREERDWPAHGRPRRAGVSSFGISGTNAHLILEQAPPAPAARPAAVTPALVPLVVSARGEQALVAQAAQLAEVLAGDGADLADVGWSLATGRAALPDRAVVLATDAAEAREALLALTAAEKVTGPVVFVFPGQGSQRVGMGAGLSAAFPEFATAFAEVCAELDKHLEVPLGEAISSEELLQQTCYAQAALFAVEIALARLLASFGVVPDLVVGHSIGELSAAVVAGMVSLPDAARVVAARGRLMQALPSGGVMAAVQAGEADVLPLLGDGVELGAVNGPRSVVLSGDREAVERVVAALGVKTRWLPVSHAFHSAATEPMLAEFETVLTGVVWQPPLTTFVSTVTGEPIESVDAAYWLRNVRETVRFGAALDTAVQRGGLVLEVGPGGVLTSLVPDGATGVAVLRDDRAEERTLLHAVGQAFAAGTAVSWEPVFGAAGRRVELPTYPFQRTRFWLTPGSGSRDVAAVGQVGSGHPLLGAAVALPSLDGAVLTGRLSVRTHPWLAEHRIAGTALLPGTGLVEMAIRAGDQVGHSTLEELVVEAPLVVPDHGGVRVQVMVGSTGPDGTRAVEVYAAPDDVDGDPLWHRHAAGVLSRRTVEPGFDLVEWPPPGARALPVDDLYPALAAQGLEYGPAFRGVVAAWRLGTDTFAEIRLPEPEREQSGRYGIHPALLDAALHAGMLEAGAADGPSAAFAWNGVALHAAGAGTLRVRLTSRADDEVTLQAADDTGAPVLSWTSLVSRPVATGRVDQPVRDAMFRVDWQAVTTPGTPAETPPHAVFRLDREDAPGGATRALDLTGRALRAVQDWLTRDDGILVVVTRGAGADDPGSAAAWGLVRAAQAEHPGRFRLLDLDGDLGDEVLHQALALDEPQLRHRDGAWQAPRLVREPLPAEDGVAWDPDGTVLITGGTGSLGAVIARHLVTTHGVRHVVLAGRRGPETPGAASLRDELGVEVVACDVTDRAALAALVGRLDRLTAVVHLAGVLDDGVVTALDESRLATVLTPKATAAAHLDELTRDRGLAAFVLFSSAAGVFGGGGQGSYGAANSFLDALAEQRRAAGRPATSLAWGLWEQKAGMTGELAAADQARMARGGLRPLSPDEGTRLLDAALRTGRPALVPVKLDLAALREQAGDVPALFRALLPARRRTSRPGGDADGLAGRLAALPAADQQQTLIDLVRSTAATVLGHPGPDQVGADKAFGDVGFDSLTAVELRNRLLDATGVRLPVTAVFDYPTPAAVARFLWEELGLTAPGITEASAVTVSRATADDPIAIVGMSCRLPGGVRTPDDLWAMVTGGRDGVVAFPDDRGWDLDTLFHPDPDHPGTSYVTEGGFLQGAGDFDAGFFGISPREALAMDPQQRLLLETSWEAVERAGIDITSLRGGNVGVFSGVWYESYGSDEAALPPGAEGFLATGISTSVTSGRVSYTFGFEGPAVTVDTACSSSLVAMHLAAQALGQGECDLALAGGATVMAGPGSFVGFSRQRGLAADGRCKSYAAGADGTGWSEGAGVVVLERLSDARRNGHPVLALLRGSAVNQDGASNGLTAPNGPSQQRVIRKALGVAGLGYADVDLVEGHGTGTRLGDPIEAQALLATYGRDRTEPLRLGSLKSNIGHAQAAAGVAGVIKTVQALRYGVMPRTLHVDAPSDQVDWTTGAVELLTENRTWPEVTRPRRAAVSAFGMSGTNAHVILEQAPPQDTPVVVESSPAPAPVVISAADREALAAQARQVRDWWAGTPDAGLADVARSLLTHRATLDHRAVVVAGSRDEALTGLSALADDLPAPGVVTGAPGPAGRVVLVFPGQGTQWAGMGAALLDSAPVFAAVIEACDELLDFSLIDVLRGDAPLDRVEVVQPAGFAVMAGLAALWAAHGVVPAAVLGHSQGEIAAAYVAGALSLSDALRVVVTRARLIGADLAGRGGMASVTLPVAEVTARLGGLEIAAVNGPNAVVVAGPPGELDTFLARCDADGVRARRIAVDYASHSSHVEAIRDALLAELGDITPRSAPVAMFSTVDGDWIDTRTLDAAYWYRNLRRPVGFEPAVRALTAQGYGVFVEVSPHPVLVPALADISAGLVTGTLRRDEGGLTRFLTSAAELYVAGIPVTWPVPAGHRVDLPTYAFTHRHYWLKAGGGATDVTSAGLAGADHPMLGAVVAVPETGGVLGTSRLSLRTHPWLADHRVAGIALLPGTALVELAVRAGDEVGCSTLEELVVEAPLVLPEAGSVRVQVTVGGLDELGRRPVAIYSAIVSADGSVAADSWVRNAGGALSAAPAAPAFDLTSWPPRDAEPVDVANLYETMAARGLQYGPAFQGVTAAWVRGDETFAEVALPPAQADEASRYGLHPALLDAAMHPAVLTGSPAEAGSDGPSVPFAWDGAVLHAGGASALRVRLTRDPSGGGLSLQAADPTGAPVLSWTSLVSRPLNPDQLSAAGNDSLFRVDWPQTTLTEAVHLPKPGLTVGGAPAAFEVWEVPAGEALDVTAEALGAVQDWLARGDAAARLVVVTHGLDEPVAAAVWGLVRSAQAEHPDRFVLLDTDGDADVARAVASGEPQLTWTAGEWRVPRLVREPVGTPEPPDLTGTVLVTGGTGSLGTRVVRHLTERYGARVVVASRTGGDVLCDVSDRDQVAELLAGIPDLVAVVHTAGVLDDGVVTALNRDRLATVFKPKVDAVRHLDELTRDRNLTAFVVFSSASGVFGAAGQANYAAANSYVDAVVARRRAQGLPGVSLAWGLWEQDSGMTGSLGATDRSRISRGGIRALSVEEGLRLFDAALGSDRAVLVPVKLDLRGQRGDVPALLSGLVPATRRTARAAGDTDRAGLAARLAGLDGAAQRDALVDVVRTQAAAVLGHAGADQIDPDRAFNEIGFDSLTAVELRNRLLEATGVRLPVTAVFDYPSPAALALFLHGAMDIGQPQAPHAVFAGFDSLESLLAGIDPDDSTRALLLERLQSLSRRVVTAGAPAGDEPVVDLSTASDDELFGLIDEGRELTGEWD